MVIIKKFAAEFEIKFTSETVYSFLDMLRLHFDILVVVKTLFHPCSSSVRSPLLLLKTKSTQ